ncbi:hypothetical protein KAH81_05145 [bacterium]|nr:hypothetical protein [bacterium]
MALLGIGLFAGLVTIILSLARDEALRKWINKNEFEESMEFASFPAKPHPIYHLRLLLWIGLVLIGLSFALLFFTDLLYWTVGFLVAGMLLFFVYDVIGGKERTSIVVLPDGLLFEPVKSDRPKFFTPYSNIEAIEENSSGLSIILKKPKLSNRLPIKTHSKEEVKAKISSALAKFKANR